MIAIHVASSRKARHPMPSTIEEAEKARCAAETATRMALAGLALVGFILGMTILYLLFKP